jgi:DtxR family Mn-dependent transcriptional regulator
MVTAELSATMRDYLAEIYRLSDRGSNEQGYISTSALADLLDVSAPAVNRMVTRLRELELLQHEPYQGIRLTNTGRREALKQLRKHRIIESFLVKVMGFEWHEVHEEADSIGKAITEPLVERMSQMADNPRFCPHGEPIPTRDGEVPDMGDMLLTQAPHHQLLQITRVRTREADRLEYLAALHLTPGVQVTILNAAPFHGPIQLKLGSEFRIIGHNLAEMIRARAVEEAGKSSK